MNGFVRILFIALFAIANAQERKNLRVGDTVNLFEEHPSKVIVSDIFNGFNGSHHIKTEKYSIFNYKKTYKTCMLFESLKEYFYPNITIDKKLTDNAASKLFHDGDLWSDGCFGVNRMYVDDQKYKYGIVKLCQTYETQSLNIELINSTHFPTFAVNGNYNILMNKTVVLRLKQDDETHYISSLSTGSCLIQIYVNDIKKCENNDNNSQDVIDDIFKTPIYKTRFTSVYKNREFEKWINEYYFLNDLDYSLFTFPHGGGLHEYNILNMLVDTIIVSVRLRSLPELPAVSKFDERHSSLQSTNFIKQDDIIPGMALNLSELLYGSPRITANNFLMITQNSVIPSSTTYSYSNCRRHNGTKTPNFENGKFDIFEAMLKRKNYGIDPEYSIEGKTCLKITVCARLKQQKLLNFPSLMVIKLNENTINNVKYDIFEEKNIMLWYSEGNETHFVRNTEKGDCLSQTLIYPGEADKYQGNSILDHDPIFNGVILSATSNRYLEEQVISLVNNDFNYIIGNRRNVTAMLKVFEELEYSGETRGALVNMYLYELL